MYRMSQPLLATRKRSRNCFDEETSDFMPLSKRINNLHINNGIFPLEEHFQPLSKHEGSGRVMVDVNAAGAEWRVAEMPEFRQTHGCPSPDETMPWGVSSTTPHQQLRQYSPDLTPHQNPYYYENNRLLFTCYMERLQRSGGVTPY